MYRCLFFIDQICTVAFRMVGWVIGGLFQDCLVGVFIFLGLLTCSMNFKHLYDLVGHIVNNSIAYIQIFDGGSMSTASG